MRIRCLADLKKPDPEEIVLSALPETIFMAHFARDKAFAISRLVRELFGDSYEWYGYTIGVREQPEVIIDIGLPPNSVNVLQYTMIGPENIAAYQETLPADQVITGWIHSHGSLEYREFSPVDAANQVAVLDYVTSLLKIPVAKKEIAIKDLVLLVQGEWDRTDLHYGSVCLITDVPVKQARLLETIFGGFCYAIVIGDDGWHTQEIHYKRRGILTGQTTVSKRSATLTLMDTGRLLSPVDLELLRQEVQEKIKPLTTPPPEHLERL